VESEAGAKNRAKLRHYFWAMLGEIWDFERTGHQSIILEEHFFL
jgi:hypothetical protein